MGQRPSKNANLLVRVLVLETSDKYEQHAKKYIVLPPVKSKNDDDYDDDDDGDHNHELPRAKYFERKLYSFNEATLIEAWTSDKYSWGIKGFNKPLSIWSN